MSILIKKMEMPNRCFECIFLTTVPNFFCLAGKRDLCAEHGINISRPDWCPLIEVQSPHGRLIDADAFDERVRVAGGMSEEELTEDFKDGVQTVLYMMSKQPTIIEAEGSDT